MKKLIASILTFILFITTVTTVYGAAYSDVKAGNWAYEAVAAMSERTIVKGYPDGSFRPGNTVTYGEFIKMALIADTGEDIGNAKEGHWAESYYNKALEEKYFLTSDIGKPMLSMTIPRSDMALIISAILGDVKIDDYDKIQKGIKDITYKTEHEYDITKAYAKGILTGYTDKTFKPEKTLTRAEAATVIYRLVDESKRVLPAIREDADEENKTNDKTLEEMITNVRTFRTEHGRIDSDLALAQTYEIDNDPAKYGMQLFENNGTKSIRFNPQEGIELGLRYLVKDNQVIDLMRLGPASETLPESGIYDFDIDITTVDYIASLDLRGHILLIANPFKK